MRHADEDADGQYFSESKCESHTGNRLAFDTILHFMMKNKHDLTILILASCTIDLCFFSVCCISFVHI